MSETLLNLAFPTAFALRRAKPSCWLVMSRGKPGCHPAPLTRRDANGAIWSKRLNLAKGTDQKTSYTYGLVEAAVVVGRVGIVAFTTVRSSIFAEEVGRWMSMYNVDLFILIVSLGDIPSVL